MRADGLKEGTKKMSIRDYAKKVNCPYCGKEMKRIFSNSRGYSYRCDKHGLGCDVYSPYDPDKEEALRKALERAQPERSGEIVAGEDIEEVISGLKFTVAMASFNPSNGEDIAPEDMNEDTRTTYEACKKAIQILQHLSART